MIVIYIYKQAIEVNGHDNFTGNRHVVGYRKLRLGDIDAQQECEKKSVEGCKYQG